MLHGRTDHSEVNSISVALSVPIQPCFLGRRRALSLAGTIGQNLRETPKSKQRAAVNQPQGAIRSSKSQVIAKSTHSHKDKVEIVQVQLTALFFSASAFLLLPPFSLASFSSVLCKMSISWKLSSREKRSWQPLECLECVPCSPFTFWKAAAARSWRSFGSWFRSAASLLIVILYL